MVRDSSWPAARRRCTAASQWSAVKMYWPALCLSLLLLTKLPVTVNAFCSLPSCQKEALRVKTSTAIVFEMVPVSRPSVAEAEDRLPEHLKGMDKRSRLETLPKQSLPRPVRNRQSGLPTVMKEDVPPAESSSPDDTPHREESNCKSSDSGSSGDNPPAQESKADSRNTTDTISARQMAVYRAGLLKQKPTAAGRQPQGNTERKTSVGDRRVGSATQARRGLRRTTQLVDAVRQRAQGLTGGASRSKQQSSDDQNDSSNMKGKHQSRGRNNGIAKLTTSNIHAAVDDLLLEKKHIKKPSQADRFSAAISSWGKCMGILGDEGSPPKSEVLCESSSLVVRVANPMDDVDIANLRLSVFADFSPEMRSQFCYRSCQALARRRSCGAVCLVATPPPDKVRPILLGSAEASYHEFESTRLGCRRPSDSLLYITEVAVHPSARRQGIGEQLLRSVDILAERRGIETVFLHVDVLNHGALALYQKCGYQLTNSQDPVFSEFTTSLNLHPGATRGRTHSLLYKDLQEPTWTQKAGGDFHGSGTKVMGNLGFEIPA